MAGQGHCKWPLEVIALSGHGREGQAGGEQVLTLPGSLGAPGPARERVLSAARMPSPGSARGWCWVCSGEGGAEVPSPASASDA